MCAHVLGDGLMSEPGSRHRPRTSTLDFGRSRDQLKVDPAPQRASRGHTRLLRMHPVAQPLTLTMRDVSTLVCTRS